MERSLGKASIPREEEEVFVAQSQGSKSSTPTQANPNTRPHSEKRSYASVAVSNPAQVPEQPWTQVKNKNRKPSQQQSTNSALNAEYQGRRIPFPREATGRQMSEADLMLVLNEALAKAGEGVDIRFSRVRYSPSGAVSALLTEKANAGLLVPRLSNTLIRAAKTVDAAIVGVKVLEHWQRLKVQGMSLDRYLREGKMELLKREVESSTGIQLKTLPRWLINENRLREQQETGNKRGSAIVITVKGESKANHLCASGFQFGGIVRVVERYWEAGPGSVCMICCGIGHEQMGSCGNRPPQCIICSGSHKVEEHRCGVAGCNKGKGKICAHVTAKCANRRGNHTANFPQCTSRHKADMQARQEKKLMGKRGKEKIQVEDASEAGIIRTEESPEPEEREESPPVDTEMELEDGEWAQDAETETSAIYVDESQNHTKNY